MPVIFTIPLVIAVSCYFYSIYLLLDMSTCVYLIKEYKRSHKRFELCKGLMFCMNSWKWYLSTFGNGISGFEISCNRGSIFAWLRNWIEGECFLKSRNYGIMDRAGYHPFQVPRPTFHPSLSILLWPPLLSPSPLLLGLGVSLVCYVIVCP